MGNLAGWVFLGGFLLLLLCIVAAAQFYFASHSPEQQPSGRRAAAARQSEPGPRVGLGAVVGVVAGRVVNSISDARRGYARARGDSAMSSVGLAPDFYGASRRVLAPENPNPTMRTHDDDIRTQDDTPDYVIPLSRLVAIETLFKKGLTALDVDRLQVGDEDVIARAWGAHKNIKVLSRAMGGTYEERRQQIKAAVPEQGAAAMAERGESGG